MTDARATASDTRWAWIYRKWPHVSQNVRFVIEEILSDPDIDWHPTAGRGEDVVFTRLIDRESGAWPLDREEVTVSVDALGRLKSVTRRNVVQVDQGRSYADLRRMLRLPTPSGQQPETSAT